MLSQLEYLKKSLERLEAKHGKDGFMVKQLRLQIARLEDKSPVEQLYDEFHVSIRPKPAGPATSNRMEYRPTREDGKS